MTILDTNPTRQRGRDHASPSLARFELALFVVALTTFIEESWLLGKTPSGLPGW